LRNDIPRIPHSSEEALFLAAESRASLQDVQIMTLPDIPDPHALAGPELIKAAKDEIRRRKIRNRHLPAGLIADHGWLMLVDLLLSAHEGRPIHIAEAADRWEMSAATTARLLAALIEERLVVRRVAEDHSPSITLHLTEFGYQRVARALLSLD